MKARGGGGDDNAMDRRTTTVSPPNYVFMHFRLNPGINEYADTCYCASAAAALFLCRRRTPVIVVGLVPKPFKMLVTVVVLLCTGCVDGFGVHGVMPIAVVCHYRTLVSVCS